MLGDGQRAASYFRRSLELAREIDNSRAEAAALDGLAGALADAGEVARAAPLFEAALEIFERLGDDASAAETLRRSLEWRGRGESEHASCPRDV
jgi:tetratricopeptide (TPR) repeat protein